MKSKKFLKVFLYVVLGVAVLACAITYFGGRYMLNLSLLPTSLAESRADFETIKNEFDENHPELEVWVDTLKSKGLFTDLYKTMSSGERHHAYLIKNENPCGRIVIAIHGYGSCGHHLLGEAKMFYEDFGCHILIPDLHAHGYSEGEAVQMGWKDADDILEWIPFAEDTLQDPAHETKMVVYGISMGAATTMNVSGKENLPPYIKGFIEDCGYTSVWDEFVWVAKRDYSAPSFPLLNVSNRMSEKKYGWSFREASPLVSVSKSTLPILFIHGSNDDFVPTSMVYPLYEAKTEGYKEIWVAEGSAHAKSFSEHNEEYRSKVGSFLEKIGF